MERPGSEAENAGARVDRQIRPQTLDGCEALRRVERVNLQHRKTPVSAMGHRITMHTA